MSFRVEFRFDETATAKAGFKIEDIRYTIKKTFAAYSLPCVADEENLAFEDADRDDDYADMWHIIIGLLKSEWFVASASSCVWIDEDGEEDVLSQAWKVRKME